RRSLRHPPSSEQYVRAAKLQGRTEARGAAQAPILVSRRPLEVEQAVPSGLRVRGGGWAPRPPPAPGRAPRECLEQALLHATRPMRLRRPGPSPPTPRVRGQGRLRKRSKFGIAPCSWFLRTTTTKVRDDINLPRDSSRRCRG